MSAPTAHAKLSSSSAYRWISCPGSVKLSEQFPSISSVYADEGTLAHDAAEQLIKTKKVTAAHKKKIDTFYKEHPTLQGSSSEVIEALEPYVDFVQEEYQDALKEDTSAQLLTEQKVDLSAWIPEGFGTTDVAIIGGKTLHIIDLKFGKGVPVFAEGNPQLWLYALGTLAMLDVIYDIDDVKMTIYQPRLENVSSARISAEDLKTWGEEVVKPAALLALTDDAPFAAGNWCQFCPAKQQCRARAESFLKLEEYRKKTLLSNEEIGELLGEVEGLTKWAEDLRDGALTRALEGESFPGWKVVEGRSNRKYKGSEEDIVKQCESAGYDKALLFESKLLTVTSMEKMMGKKQFAEVLGGFIEKPQGKPTLAPESDKRPAITNNSAADDFADE
jgi:hypothetical protein